MVCSVSDITDRKQLLDRLAWEARNDPLTVLANRSGFLAAVEGALEAQRPRTATALVMFFFDLDRFKLVNDSLGHAVGDEVLLAMAERLRAAMPRRREPEPAARRRVRRPGARRARHRRRPAPGRGTARRSCRARCS